MSEDRPFEGYTPEFQTSVLSLMYHEPVFLEMIAGVVQPEHFDEKVDSIFAEIFLNYAEHYKEPISRTVVYAEIRKLKAKKKIEEEDLENYIRRFAEIVKPAVSPDWIKKEVRDFVCFKALEVELVNATDLLAKKSFKELVDRVQKAYEKVTKSADLRPEVSIRATRTERIERYADPEGLTKVQGHASGFSELDTILFLKGVGPGEMIVFCGSPGRGKSIALMNTALKGVEDGENILYYTLEVAQTICENRIDSCVTGVPVVELYRNARIIDERWTRVEKRSLGEIFLVDLPPRYLTPNMIRADLRRYADRGIKIDRVVVDYADIMASDRKIEERRLEHGDVYEQLRGVAKEYLVSVWTASQANRTSLHKAEVDIDALAEDFSKAFTADYVIGLSQTKVDLTTRFDGRGTGLMNLFIGKNRNGKKAFSVPVFTDFVRMRMSIEDWDAFDKRYYGALSFRLPLAI